jgi:hypothetical protein
MFRTALLLVLLMGSAFQARAEWSFCTINTMGVTPSIAIDDNGYPGVVYARDPFIKYATFDGSYWTEENIYQSPYGGCGYTGLVFDEQGVPHVSFKGGGGVILYAVMNPEERSWTVEDFSYSLGGSWTSIALTPEGYPCIAWYSFDEHLGFITWTGGGWTQEIVDQSADVGACNSMAIDESGVAHIAYCGFEPDKAVRYARRVDTGIWETFTVDSSMSSEPLGTSLAIDDNGNPRVSYSADGEVRYAEYDGTAWTIQTVYATDTGIHTYGTSLALDQYGYPHIAHCCAGGDSLMYSVNQGGGWQTEFVHPVSSIWNSGDPDLALDQQATPHIVFCYEGVQYAHNDQPSQVGLSGIAIDSDALSVSPTPFSNGLAISFTLPGGTDVGLNVFDMSGRLVSVIRPGHLAAGDHSLVWRPESSLPSGQYIVVLSAGEVRASERVVFLR